MTESEGKRNMTSHKSTVDKRLPEFIHFNELKLNYKAISGSQESIRPEFRSKKRKKGVASNVGGQ